MFDSGDLVIAVRDEEAERIHCLYTVEHGVRSDAAAASSVGDAPFTRMLAPASRVVQQPRRPAAPQIVVRRGPSGRSGVYVPICRPARAGTSA